jgi:hypothetical protein
MIGSKKKKIDRVSPGFDRVDRVPGRPARPVRVLKHWYKCFPLSCIQERIFYFNVLQKYLYLNIKLFFMILLTILIYF